MAAVDDQLKRLQTDYIDVYQVHRLDPHTPIEETMYTLDQIVKSGKVRYIGGSTMPAYKFAQMIMIADHRRAMRGRLPCRISTISSSARKSAR